MITADEYFGAKTHSDEQTKAADGLLEKVNALLDSVIWAYPIDPDTGTSISGVKGGAGDGGFRLPDSKTGAAKSKHKLAHAVDVFDPDNILDASLTDELLKEFGLFREHPDATNGWCHLQDLPPGAWRMDNDKRTFYP